VRAFPAAAGITLLDGVLAWSPAVLGPARRPPLSASDAEAVSAHLWRRRFTAKREQRRMRVCAHSVSANPTPRRATRRGSAPPISMKGR